MSSLFSAFACEICALRQEGGGKVGINIVNNYEAYSQICHIANVNAPKHGQPLSEVSAELQRALPTGCAGGPG